MGPKERTLILLLIILCLEFQFHGEAEDIHDVLAEYGFPRGLLPNNAVSYTLSSDATISVQLEAPCYVYWKQQLVYYHTQINGTLTYASVSHVSGIQAQKLFLWFPVTGITLHQRSATLQFFVGPFSQTFPAADFQDAPACTRSSLSLSLSLCN
ncbi:hypothetical protein Fmac_004621 [Flemingia macrophylla]|uniref:Uncharacterized protein n=1 Tax=Flemingia macrophylla TaxID=520843 RepID=A0ABD1N635_9FABA